MQEEEKGYLRKFFENLDWYLVGALLYLLGIGHDSSVFGYAPLRKPRQISFHSGHGHHDRDWRHDTAFQF